MNTEPLRYVAAIVIADQCSCTREYGFTLTIGQSVTDKNVRLLHVLDNNGSSKIVNGRFTTRRTQAASERGL